MRITCQTCPKLCQLGSDKYAFYFQKCSDPELKYKAYLVFSFISWQYFVGRRSSVQTVLSFSCIISNLMFSLQFKSIHTLILPFSNSYFYFLSQTQVLLYFLTHYQNCHIYFIISMGIFRKILDSIPRPFRYLQRKLDIQVQWKQFKTNIRPHRYKLSLIGLAIFYPLYSTYVKQVIDMGKRKIGTYIKQSTQPKQPAFQWTQNLLKHLLEHVFTDPRVKDEALDFLFSILKDEKFYNNLLQLLVSALKSQSFMSELKVAVKQILIDELKDPEIRTSIDDFLINLSKNQRIKFAFIHLIQDVFSSKQSEQTLVSLLQKGVSNQQVKEALGQSVNFAVRQVLSDQQTLNQLKIFIFFLLRKFETDDEIKGMMDILFAKGLGLVKKKKDPELDKFLRPKKTDMM